jgi:hypothetical protein
MFDRITTLDRTLLDQAARILGDIDAMRDDPLLQIGYKATLAANLRGYVGFSDRGTPVDDPTAIGRLRTALHVGLRVLTDPRFQLHFVARGRIEAPIEENDNEA